MEIVFGDSSIGVKDKDREYIFSVQTKGLESFRKNGREWLFRSPKPSFWRATTDNDRGNGFPLKSSLWMGADMFINLKAFSVRVDETELTIRELSAPENSRLLTSPLRNADKAVIRYTYETVTVPSAEVDVFYTVTEGRLHIDFEYRGAAGLPELPVCAMRFILPFPADSYDYTGLSGETYPDRMKGGVKGRYHIEGMPVTQYVVPQECGMHMDTESLSIIKGSDSITLESVRNFNFSLLPYTAQELENAYHHDELPPVRRSVLLVAAAVRGVGGINSWGAEPEEKYHLKGDGIYRTSFSII